MIRVIRVIRVIGVIRLFLRVRSGARGPTPTAAGDGVPQHWPGERLR